MLSDAPSALTVTNGDLWLATQPAEEGQRPALTAILKVPTSVLEVRNGSALSRAVEAVMVDVHTARNAMLEQHCEKREDGRYNLTPAFLDAETALMAEPVTLPNVRAMKMSAFAQGSFVAPEDVRRCGPLLTD